MARKTNIDKFAKSARRKYLKELFESKEDYTERRRREYEVLRNAFGSFPMTLKQKDEIDREVVSRGISMAEYCRWKVFGEQPAGSPQNEEERRVTK